jgi:dienelactone hydrolase
MITRRRTLVGGAALAFTAGLQGCGLRLSDLQPNCPVSWAASILSPVFYGYRDYPSLQARTNGASAIARVFYPSLDGTPAQASILQQCERFPLVMIVHGDCNGLDPYASWHGLASQLARTGYVVAVTANGGFLADGTIGTISPFLDLLAWLRGGWEYADRVMPAPNTGLIGHSFGATLCADIAATVDVAAFVSVSGMIGQLENAPGVLKLIKCPSLYTWGDSGGDLAKLFTGYEPPSSLGYWPDVTSPKHLVIFNGAAHGDYFPDSAGAYCGQGSGRGTCPLVPQLIADYVTAFLSRYVTPEFAWTSPSWVPDSLVLRPQDMPVKQSEQSFYAGAYLDAFAVSSIVIEPDRGATCFQRSVWDYGDGPRGVWVNQAV